MTNALAAVLIVAAGRTVADAATTGAGIAVGADAAILKAVHAVFAGVTNAVAADGTAHELGGHRTNSDEEEGDDDVPHWIAPWFVGPIASLPQRNADICNPHTPHVVNATAPVGPIPRPARNVAQTAILGVVRRIRSSRRESVGDVEWLGVNR